MGGACFLSALSAYRTGAGMVRIFTATDNRESLLKKLPEAIVDTYQDAIYGVEGLAISQEESNTLLSGIEWADVVAIGPGISVSEKAKAILTVVLAVCDKPMVLDADALNILSQSEELLRNLEYGYKKYDLSLIHI